MKRPEAIEQEKKLLSALMLEDMECVMEVGEKLKAEEFYREEHRRIYSAIMRVAQSGVVPDILSVEDELNKSGDIKAVRRDYLFALIDYEFTTARAAQYVEIIKEKAQRRQLIRCGEELASEAGDESKELVEAISSAESKLLKATEGRAESSQDLMTVMTAAYDLAQNRRKNGGQLLGTGTGLIALDRLTCGLKATDLIVLAARPSMGKTALALNIAANAAKEIPVAIFSLEMSTEQLGQRMLSMASGIEATKIATGDYSDDEMQELMYGISAMEKRIVQIDDESLTLAELRMRARRMKRKYNIGLIVIDYIQLIIGDKSYKGNRVQEVSDISRQLKAMAKELNVPVLAISQLNRGAEQRADKRPMLSDLRESGSIEQDADIVIFLYRDAYYNEDSDWTNVAELHVAKNRNGATGRCNLYFDGSRCRFKDLLREATT